MHLDPFYLIVDSADWLPRLLPQGVRLAQLRVKDRTADETRDEIARARDFCRSAGAQLIVNDYWRDAIDLDCDFVHLGQEDLDVADITAIRRHGVRIGVSTHTEEELERALALNADYVALGPVWPTLLKEMTFAPQGLARVRQWKNRLGDTPLVAIGGLTPARACLALATGADSACVVTDVLRHPDPEARAAEWTSATAPWRDTPELCRRFDADHPGAQVFPSPNHGLRTRAVTSLILHYTGMPSAESALELLCSPIAQVSAHYLVDDHGGILQLVPETRRAWHAGASYWAGETDLNSSSVGIEVAHPGHNDPRPFTPAQIAAVIELSRDICDRHAIPPGRVLAHSDIAPRRKIDPGEFFPWETLAQNGVGCFVTTSLSPARPRWTLGDKSADVAQLQRRLADFGYRIEATGVYDEDTATTVTAFQRHYRPARVDGLADDSTCEALTRLLETRA